MLRTGVMRFSLLRNERGMVLPIALGILSVLSISAVVVLDSSSTNARSSTRSKGDKVAFALAEAGINNAVAVLSKTGNDNMHQSLLPPCKSGQAWTSESTWKLNDGGTPAMKYEGGDVRWCATFDAGNAVWHVTSRGIVRNHYGTAAFQKRELRADIPITPIETQPLTNQAWNFMFATRTGTASGCDLTFSNNVTIGSNVYAMGNLCLDQNVVLSSPKLIALGKIYVGEQRPHRHVGDQQLVDARRGAGRRRRRRVLQVRDGRLDDDLLEPVLRRPPARLLEELDVERDDRQPDAREHHAAYRRLAGLVHAGDAGPGARRARRRAARPPVFDERRDAEQQHRDRLRPDAGRLELHLPRRPCGQTRSAS